MALVYAYHRTSWATLSSWSAWGWSTAAPYSYGENVYYQGGDVYYNDSPVATEQEYAMQAQTLATTASVSDRGGDN